MRFRLRCEGRKPDGGTCGAQEVLDTDDASMVQTIRKVGTMPGREIITYVAHCPSCATPHGTSRQRLLASQV